jgi:hypothetical protein
MAELLQEEKQKTAFPEIRDTADNYAEEYTDGYTDDIEGNGAEAEAIDVDIDNMVWEVDTEPADEYEAEDAYSGEIYENSSGQSAGGQRFDEYDEYDDSEEDTWHGPVNDGYEEIEYSRKINKHVFTWALSLVCGMYGVDRFARGQVGLGIMKLLSFGGFGFWYMADLAVAIYKSYFAPDAMSQEDLHFDDFGRYV